MTKFEELKSQVLAGTVNVPSVSSNGGNISFLGYQLSVHVYNLGLMGLGMTFSGITFKEIKDYYGLKGRSAKDCLPQLKAIHEEFKAERYI